MKKPFDCVVIGTGAMGSAALYHAAKRGWSVLGLDRFPAGHDRGSSHGQTRIIRQAYFEHPDYVPLVLDAYKWWAEIEKASGERLFEQCGLLQVGRPDGPIIGGIRKSADRHQLQLTSYGFSELQSQFPMFRFDSNTVGLFEPVAGYLHVERCVRTMISQAVLAGAEIVEGVSVLRWTLQKNKTWRIETDRGEFLARRIVVTVGAWAPEHLDNIGCKLQVIAKHQHWFQTGQPGLTLEKGCPVYFFETVHGFFYGFPDFDGNGNKVAEHSGKSAVADPLNIDRSIDARDLERVSAFVAQHLITQNVKHCGHSVCMYTMTPDEHFVVDTLDPSGSVAVGCGFSGHGFKFAPLIGKALVDMVDGKRRDEMEFLRMNRFSNC
jgi:sarcosine oxidase